jgi:hypothetical protein
LLLGALRKAGYADVGAHEAAFCTNSTHLRDPAGCSLAELESACEYASAENTCILRQCYDAYDCGRADRKAAALSLVERLEGVELGERLDAALKGVKLGEICDEKKNTYIQFGMECRTVKRLLRQSQLQFLKEKVAQADSARREMIVEICQLHEARCETEFERLIKANFPHLSDIENCPLLLGDVTLGEDAPPQADLGADAGAEHGNYAIVAVVAAAQPLVGGFGAGAAGEHRSIEGWTESLPLLRVVEVSFESFAVLVCMLTYICMHVERGKNPASIYNVLA